MIYKAETYGAFDVAQYETNKVAAIAAIEAKGFDVVKVEDGGRDVLTGHRQLNVTVAR